MIQDSNLPFGKTADGRMVTVEAVARGLDCECFCPKCQAPLVAAKGEIYRHHFRHYVERECSGARETAIHLFAKQIICEKLLLRLPDPVGSIMVEAIPECRIGHLTADVLCKFDNHETVAVEIWVKHQSTQDKVKFYNDRRQAAVEINLGPYRLADRSEAEWEVAVLEQAERNWLSPPEAIRRAREMEREHWLQQQTMKVAARLAEMRQAECDRIEAEQQAEEAQTLLDAKRREQLQQEMAEREQQRLTLALKRSKDAETTRVMLERLKREKYGPNLQDLVIAHGGWNRITPEAWEAFDAARKRWQDRVAIGEFHQTPYDAVPPIGQKPFQDPILGEDYWAEIQQRGITVFSSEDS